jgi:riboflavin kinase/FMN adenylyltransferase
MAAPADAGDGTVRPMSYDRDRVRDSFRPHRAPCVATFGTFDGVHRGHRRLIAEARAWADDLGVALTAVTLSPRPEQVFAAAHALPDLCSLTERVRRLRRAGADRVVVMPFDREIAAIAPEDMVRALRDDLGAVGLMVGADFALGAGRAGTPDRLRALGLDVRCAALTPSRLRPGTKASSSALRRIIAATGSREGALADA